MPFDYHSFVLCTLNYPPSRCIIIAQYLRLLVTRLVLYTRSRLDRDNRLRFMRSILAAEMPDNGKCRVGQGQLRARRRRLELNLDHDDDHRLRE